jgi:hypothetical protein
MDTLENSIQNALKEAMTARDNLIHKSGEEWFPKVCCDEHIRYSHEAHLSLKQLQNPKIFNTLAKKNVDLPMYNLSAQSRRDIESEKTKFLCDLYLSSRSYVSDHTKNHLGCCINCKSSIHGAIRSENPKPPVFVIVNGLMIGTRSK